MRLAVVMATHSPWSRHVALQLASLGHEIHVVDLAGARKGEYIDRNTQKAELIQLREGVAGLHHLGSLGPPATAYLAAAPELRGICRRHRIQMLLTLYGGKQAVTAYLSGVRPYSVFVVGDDVLKVRGIKRLVAKVVLRSAAIVFANGAHLAEQTAALVPSARIVPLLLGIDTDRFVPGSREDPPVRVVCSRGFLPVYNNEFLVRGLAALPGPVPNFTFDFLSGGPLLPEVKALAADLLDVPTLGRVRFSGGASCDEILASLQRSHVFVSMSRSDGTATSLLEALACGLFPVLSDIPQNREWVNPALDNGLLVPLGDASALGAAIVRAILDRPMRDRASAVNRALVAERACSRRNMAFLAEELQNVSSVRASRPGGS